MRSGYRAGVPAVQIPLSTTSAIGTLNGVTNTVTAITPDDSYFNGVAGTLPAGNYQILAGMVGEDQANGGYTVGPCFVASPAVALAVTAGQVIQVAITGVNVPVNGYSAAGIALFVLFGGNTLAQYAGIFPIPASGEIDVFLESLPLLQSPFFSTTVLTGSSNDPAQILGSRSPFAYNWTTLGPTGSGADVDRNVAQITFTPDVSADVNVATVRSTLCGFATLPNQMKAIVQAAGGVFIQKTVANKIQQGRLSPQVVQAIFPGNRPFRLLMPLNSDGSQEVRTYLSKVIVNQDQITEQWRKTQQTLIQWRLADIPEDTLLLNQYTELNRVN